MNRWILFFETTGVTGAGWGRQKKEIPCPSKSNLDTDQSDGDIGIDDERDGPPHVLTSAQPTQ